MSHVYTLWKYKRGEEDALYLTTEPVFKTKHFAFKRARELARELPKGWDLVILVRRISFDSDVCKEWEFQPE